MPDMTIDGAANGGGDEILRLGNGLGQTLVSPRAIFDAMAEERVQPVPWRLWVGIFSVENSRMVPSGMMSLSVISEESAWPYPKGFGQADGRVVYRV